MENSAFQAVLYIIIALADWLEYDTITDAEVIAACKIIVPEDLWRGLTPSKKYPKLTGIITEAIVSKDLVPTEDAVDLISAFMEKVSGYINSLDNEASKRIMNRLMVFCQPV